MIGALIMIATIELGIGERSAVLSLVSLGVLGLSAYVTDSTGMFRLRQSMANCAALGVVVVSAIDAYAIDRHGQLYAVADLQSYLQYVLLFQPKTPRVYWQLAVLSLGQVAIASTLVPGPLFGVMLLAYVFVGIITFALLLLYSESKRLARPTSRARDHARPALAEPQGSGKFAPVLIGSAGESHAGSISWGLLRQATLISTLGAASAIVLFLLLPRWDVENREVASREPLHSVGFSKTVTLGELGEVTRNPNVVMRVQLLRAIGQEVKPFKLNGEPLFRGCVVSRYEGGSWTHPHPNSFFALPRESSRVEESFGAVRQRITVEPLDVPELCCVFPIHATQPDSRLRISARLDSLIRQEDSRERQLEFEIGTTGIMGNVQRKIVPCDTRVGRRELEGMVQMSPTSLAGQGDPLAGLRAAAGAVLRDQNIDPQNRVAAAKALDDYLSKSGNFFYSLDPQARSKTMDPLEDFVTTHREGHCEYFAGALVMLLRSQGIPARMAIGFKGGEWNPLGMYYQVQQLHAHAWVEVYLRTTDIPPGSVAENSGEHGAWMLLDPTEGAQERNAAEVQTSFLTRWRQYLDYARVLWASYVAGLNSKRQQQTIYEPLTERTSSAIHSVFDRDSWWRDSSRETAASHLSVFWDWYRRHWFSWRGGVVAAGFSLALIALGGGARRLVAMLRHYGLVGARRFFDEAPVLEIYRRLETALGKRGLRRLPGQTAYEFAVAAGGDLAESVEHHRLAPLPRRIVEAFYRVRFGGRTLDNLEADAVEHALVELELALGRPR
jgi:hypothetical protein